VLFNNGAWDFAADTRGYSNGIAVAWINPGWALRLASLQMPTFANGNRFDDDIGNARGDNVELTVAGPRRAVIRLLGFVNHGRMGRYEVVTSTAQAQGTTPDIVADDAPGRIKYGVGANAELPLGDDGNTGVFGRLGWNDGRTESFVFTEADGLSRAHREYLAAGGRGFLLGDGGLRYGRETLFETYYDAALGPSIVIAPDAMLIVNPGYNRDRGPARVYSVRLRISW
jgi:hypothetical protein